MLHQCQCIRLPNLCPTWSSLAVNQGSPSSLPVRFTASITVEGASLMVTRFANQPKRASSCISSWTVNSGFEPKAPKVHNLVECPTSQNLAEVRGLHLHMICNPIEKCSEHRLIQLFVSYGCLLEANLVFCACMDPDLYTWEAIISAHVMLQECRRAFEMYEIMKEGGLTPSKSVVVSLLKACGNIGASEQGKLLHFELITMGFDADIKVGSTLVHMYGTFGFLLDARNVFDLLPNRNSVSWGAMIAAYAQHDDGRCALQLFQEMQQVAIKPDKVVFLCIFGACGTVGIVGNVEVIHDQSIRAGYEGGSYLGSALVDAYSKCGYLKEARRVFDVLAARDEVSWGAMVAGYTQHGCCLLACDLLARMQQEGIKLGRVTLLCMLKLCRSRGDLEHGMLIHMKIVALDLERDLVVGSALIDMYGRCGGLEEAQKLFDKLPKRNLVTWNTMITGYTQAGHGAHALALFEAMQQDRVKPDRVIYLSVLKACGIIGATQYGNHIHDKIIRNKLELDVTIASSLIDMYARSACLEEARSILDKLDKKNTVCWGAMISGYVQYGQDLLALKTFELLQEKKIEPDSVVFSCTLKACGRLGSLEQGKAIHELVLSNKVELDVVVGNALIDMYAKCGAICRAREVFDSLPNRNVVSWNSMITGYADLGQGFLALTLFDEMHSRGVEPDAVTYSSVFKACSSVRAVEKGRFIHNEIKGSSFEEHDAVGSSIVDMYAKCGELKEAQHVFERLRNCSIVAWNALLGGYTRCGRLVEALSIFTKSPNRNLISWNTLLAGYVQHGFGFSTLELFEQMQQEGVKPDKVTFLCTLKACGIVAALGQARMLHHQTIQSGLVLDLMVGNTIIDMYANCGSLKEAQATFKTLPAWDDASWGAIIAAHALHGEFKSAVQCFGEMHRQGFLAKDSTYTSILAACSHARDVDGWQIYFKSLKYDYGAMQSLEHFNCMIDLLGHAGCLDEAKAVLQTMPISPDITGWLSLLLACQMHADVSIGKHCFDRAIQLDPNVGSGYVLMSNIYNEAHMYKESRQVQGLKTCFTAEKKAGKACLEIDCMVHEFVVGCKADVRLDHFDVKLQRLSRLLKDVHFIPQLNLVL